jgi:hypothetical protein
VGVVLVVRSAASAASEAAAAKAAAAKSQNPWACEEHLCHISTKMLLLPPLASLPKVSAS